MLPDLSVVWVIFFLLLLTVILDRLLFRPIQRVIKQREEATRSARELAERSAREARRGDGRVRAQDGGGAGRGLRADGRDAARRAVRRAPRSWHRTRAEAEQEIAAASAQLQAETEEARRRFERGGRRARRRGGRADPRPQGFLTRSSPTLADDTRFFTLDTAGPPAPGRRGAPRSAPGRAADGRASRPRPNTTKASCRRSPSSSTSRSWPASSVYYLRAPIQSYLQTRSRRSARIS